MCHFILASMVSDEKCAFIQIVFSPFSLGAFKIFFLFLIFKNLIMIYHGIDFFWFILFVVCSAIESVGLYLPKF